MRMFIFLYLPCDIGTQKARTLYRIYRQAIQEWERTGLVSRAVLKHTTDPGNPDFLQVCLDIPTVDGPKEATAVIPEDARKQIPSAIIRHFEDVCQKNGIRGELRNFRSTVEQAKRKTEQEGESYYDHAKIEDVIQFSSVGTQIAFEVLDKLEKDANAFASDATLGDYIYSRLGDTLGADFRWMDEAFHLTCMSLGIDNRNEASVRLFLPGHRALGDARKTLGFDLTEKQLS